MKPNKQKKKIKIMMMDQIKIKMMKFLMIKNQMKAKNEKIN